jgi:hypothetical protein
MSKVALEHEVLAEVWVLTQYPKGRPEFVFAMGRTPQEAYSTAGMLMADPPVSTEQLKEMGYKPEKVLLVRAKVETER